jgi:hypothetical protein
MSVQIIGHAYDINIMGRTKRAISEVYGELKERAKEVDLTSRFKKQSNGAKQETRQKRNTDC